MPQTIKNAIGSFLSSKEELDASTDFKPVVDVSGNLIMSPQEEAYFNQRAELEKSKRAISPSAIQDIYAEKEKKKQEYENKAKDAESKIKAEFKQTMFGKRPLDFEQWAAYKKTPEYASKVASVLEAQKPEQPEQPEPAPAPTVAEVPVGEEAKEEPKETPVTPPLAPEGGVPAGTAGTQAPAVDIQALKEPNKEAKKNQEALPESLTELSAEKARLELQNKYGKTVDRSSLKKALDNLGKVDDQIKALYENNPPPQLAEVAQARREALQAYKEKATLNEWLAIADRAINAIGQFASAQAAMGTPFVGSFKPAFADYESRTAQALREYQAEAALLQEERQESEKARAEDIRLKEQAGERIRRGAEQQYRLAQEDIRAQEQAVDKADRMISDIYSANISLRKNAQDIEAAVQKYQKAQQVKDAEAQKDATQSILKLEMDRQKNAIDVSQKLLQAANELAANPNDDKALTKFLAAQGKSGETLKAEIAERPEFWTSGKIQGLASATATELEGRIKTATERSNELSTQLQSLLGGGQVSLAPAPASKQQVPVPVQQFKESDVDAAIAAGQYPGLTKVQVLDKLKQKNISIIMGQ